MRKSISYEIMQGEHVVARMDQTGRSRIVMPELMPYDLYLEEEEDMDSLVNNITNFQYWCASRVLTLDRQYAKAMMNSIGVKQAVTDRDRAEISLSYHCVSLTDIFWVRQSGEAVTFEQVNLYDNHLNMALVEISLRGRQMTVTNRELAQDLSTRGCFPKAWIRKECGFQLLKDGGEEVVQKELLASKICQCFDIAQVQYEAGEYKGQIVTVSNIITDKKKSIVTKAAFDIYAWNHDLDPLEECCKLDKKAYYGMNIIDYLTGNTDRHPENWGLLIDNRNNRPISLHPLMDFNQAFSMYDDIDGANCQTVLPRHLTQKEAAIEAVKEVGLLQKSQIQDAWFEGKAEWKQEFKQRLAVLREYI